MEKQYLLSVDQSTQGTKALLFDQEGNLICRGDRPHRQIINDAGWVSHDLNEIYSNTLKVVRDVIEKAGIRREQVAGLGISNQRETSAVWGQDRRPSAGRCHCVAVFQGKGYLCAGGGVREGGMGAPYNRNQSVSLLSGLKTGVVHGERKGGAAKSVRGNSLPGDHRQLPGLPADRGTSFKTDYSNASRTQLFNIHSLEWDEGLCSLFGIPVNALAQVCDSNAWFGDTDLEGYLDNPIPIHGVLGIPTEPCLARAAWKRG